MSETRQSTDNRYKRNADGTITAFREVGADPTLHIERNRWIQEYASRQLPEDYGVRVRYVDEIGKDPVFGRMIRGGVAFRNDPYNTSMITDIVIDKFAFDLDYLRNQFKGIEFDWKDVVLHECGHAAYLDFMPSAQGPIVLDGGYLMNEYYAMRAAAGLPGAVSEPQRAERLMAAAELYLKGELG